MMDSADIQQPESFEEVILQIASTLPPGYPRHIPSGIEGKLRSALAELSHALGPKDSPEALRLFLKECATRVLTTHNELLEARQQNIPDLPAPDPWQAASQNNFWEEVERMISSSALPDWRGDVHTSKPQPADSEMSAGSLWRQEALSDAGKKFDLYEITSQEGLARLRKLLDLKRDDRRR